MLIEPGLRLHPVRYELVNETPKFWFMIEFAQMSNFVCDDVIEHEGWCHDKAP